MEEDSINLEEDLKNLSASGSKNKKDSSSSPINLSFENFEKNDKLNSQNELDKAIIVVSDDKIDNYKDQNFNLLEEIDDKNTVQVIEKSKDQNCGICGENICFLI